MDVIFKRIYEGNISGKLSRDYEQEQKRKKTNVRKFISVVKKYTDMTQLDATIPREFAEQIRAPPRPTNSKSG